MRETNTMKSLITVITKVFEEEEDLEGTLISVRDGSLRESYLMDDLYKNNWPEKGLFHWFKFMSSEAECELLGFLEPIHIWQGMEDLVVPASMTDYVVSVLPSVVVHKLPDHGHFSYFYFCDECHIAIMSILFGKP